MHRWIDWLWYRRHEGILTKLLLLPLWLVSLVFGWMVSLRVRRWRAGGRARRVQAEVVSIGNLTVGGAGKTPVAIHITRFLREAGVRTAVLSRGYGRTSDGLVEVADSERVLTDAARGGDEPLLLARSCPGVPVVVARDRASAAEHAVARFGAQVVVLDDGFQHLRLHRGLDVVVLDATAPYGNGYLLPRGPLREGREALRRAGLVWISKADQASAQDVDVLRAEALALTGREPVVAAYRVVDVLDGGGGSLGPTALQGCRVLLVAGLARPGSFRRTLESCGATVVAEMVFPDHHRFTEQEITNILSRTRAAGADALALTEKDAVRLPSLDSEVRVVRIESKILSGESSLREVLAPLIPASAVRITP